MTDKDVKQRMSLNLNRAKNEVIKLERRASMNLKTVKSKVSLFANDIEEYRKEKQNQGKNPSALSTLERAKRAFRFKPFIIEATAEWNGKEERFLRCDEVYYLMGEVIGRGGYGVVSSAVRLDTRKYVAIKTLSKFHERKDAIRESDMHKLMGTSRGEPILSSFGGHHSIVMKLIIGRKLEQEYKDPDSKFSPLKLYRQAKFLLNTLHSHQYFHGDSNTGNFMVEKSGKLYLLDYGASGNLVNLSQRMFDYKKLVLNTLDEVKFRTDEDSLSLVEEAREDLQKIMEVCGDEDGFEP